MAHNQIGMAPSNPLPTELTAVPTIRPAEVTTRDAASPTASITSRNPSGDMIADTIRPTAAIIRSFGAVNVNVNIVKLATLNAYINAATISATTAMTAITIAINLNSFLKKPIINSLVHKTSYRLKPVISAAIVNSVATRDQHINTKTINAITKIPTAIQRVIILLSL